MPAQHVVEIKEGDIFVTPDEAPRSGFRRVLGVLGGRVRYSIGGDNDRTCLITTFKRWMRVNKARDAKHRGRPEVF